MMLSGGVAGAEGVELCEAWCRNQAFEKAFVVLKFRHGVAAADDIEAGGAGEPFAFGAGDAEGHAVEGGEACAVEITGDHRVAAGDADGIAGPNDEFDEAGGGWFQEDDFEAAAGGRVEPLGEPAAIGGMVAEKREFLGKAGAGRGEGVEVDVAVGAGPAADEEIDGDTAEEPERCGDAGCELAEGCEDFVVGERRVHRGALGTTPKCGTSAARFKRGLGLCK